MTTIIIIVVVALVFFVSLCTVTFMVWKREEEMRTDSLRAIEANLQELGYRMTEDYGRSTSRLGARTSVQRGIEPLTAREPIGRTDDPFSWTRETIPPVSVNEDDPLETELVAASEPQEPEAPAVTDAGTEVAEVESPATLAEPEHKEEAEAGAEEPKAEDEEPVGSDELGDESDFHPLGDDDTEPLGSDFEDDVLAMLEALGELGAPDEAGASDQETNVTTDDSALNGYEQLMSDDFQIDLDGIDVPELMGGYIADYSAEEIPQPRSPMGRDVGRSGRKYTAEELDMLIKE